MPPEKPGKCPCLDPRGTALGPSCPPLAGSGTGHRACSTGQVSETASLLAHTQYTCHTAVLMCTRWVGGRQVPGQFQKTMGTALMTGSAELSWRRRAVSPPRNPVRPLPNKVTTGWGTSKAEFSPEGMFYGLPKNLNCGLGEGGAVTIF